jgi:peptidoglycan hydrolase-like protein with peptidoglycan-binding domain
MKKMTTAACAVALGFAWAIAPAIAQEAPKDKAERKADQIEQKGEQKAAETKAKAEQKADKVRANAEGKTDTMGNKAERAWDKTKAKTHEMTDKVKDKMSRDDSSGGDVRAAQQALRDKGFDPGPIDGMKGPRTTAAIKEFQQKENLPATGTLDSQTRTQLMASVPSASPAAEPSTKRQTR